MRTSRLSKISVSVYFLLLLALIIARAILVPFISDEAQTYFLYIDSGTSFGKYATIDANNHVLNSVLSTFSIELFGLNPFAMRLPNVLAFILFFFSTVSISKRLSSSILKVVFITVLTSIFPILEFFSLCRGYGISFALLMLCISQLFKFNEDGKTLRAFWIVLICIGILLSQLSLLFAVTSAFAVLSILSFRKFWSTKKWLFFTLVVFAISSLTYFVIYTKFLQDAGMLYYGIKDNFPFYNITSINLLVFGFDTPILTWTIICGMLLLSLSTIAIVLMSRLDAKILINNIFGVMLIASISGIVLSIVFMNGLGPLDRTGLYLYLLLFASFVFLFDHIKKLAVVPVTFGVFVLLSSIKLAQINQVNLWSNDKFSPELIRLIADNYNSNESIGSSTELENSSSFYLNHYALNIGAPINPVRDRFFPFDLLLFTKNDRNRFSDELKNYEELYADTLGISLFKNKNVLKNYEKLIEFKINISEDHYDYINLATVNLEGRILKAGKILIELQSELKRRTYYMVFVYQFFDKNESCIATHAFPINRLTRRFNSFEKFSISIPIIEIPDEATELRLFFHNSQGHKIINFTCSGGLYFLKFE